MMFNIIQDILLVKKILSFTDKQLADTIGVSRSTLNRWIKGESKINYKMVDIIYSFIYKNNIDINAIKSQLYIEDYKKNNHAVLFHGAKDEIVGDFDLNHSKNDNDFGKALYFGESLEQSAMYVSHYKKSSIYIVDANLNGLKGINFDVDLRWMLAIALYRGRLEEYKDSKLLTEIKKEIEKADYIVAPIADNKMFSIINNFIDGELTDEQCCHCLSATDLGKQYVIKTEKAIKQLKIIDRLYMCDSEKESYLKEREESVKLGNDKVKAARIKYQNVGKYIDVILGEK